MGKRGSCCNKRRKAASSSGITLVPQGSGSIKRTPRNPFDPIGSDDTDFRVREIRAERTAGTKLQWLISWEGFDDSAEDTWEPIGNLVGCEQALTLFRQQRDESTAAASERAKKRKAERAAEVDLTGKYWLRSSFLPSCCVPSFVAAIDRSFTVRCPSSLRICRFVTTDDTCVHSPTTD